MGLPPFSAVLDAHGGVVWRYVSAMAGPVDAPDLYQETLLAALRTYPALRDASNLRAWLLTIAHAKVVDGYRAGARRPFLVAEPEPAAVAPVEPADDDLWAAVAKLPEKQRAAVVGRYVGDLAYADVALVVGCSEPAARQNVRAGLARLREELS
jgi:RNA polymerase sigma factor (sigma-70 family)